MPYKSGKSNGSKRLTSRFNEIKQFHVARKKAEIIAKKEDPDRRPNFMLLHRYYNYSGIPISDVILPALLSFIYSLVR